MSYPAAGPQPPHPPGSQPPGPPSGPPERPALAGTMAIATELWLVVIAMEIVTAIGMYQSVRDSYADGASKSQQVSDPMFLTAYIIGNVVLATISLLIWWYAREGRKVARMLLSFGAVYVVVQTVMAFFAQPDPRWVMIPTVLAGVAGLGVAAMILNRDTERFCAEMDQYRTDVARWRFLTSTPYPLQVHPHQQPGPYPPGPYARGSYPPVSNPYQQQPVPSTDERKAADEHKDSND